MKVGGIDQAIINKKRLNRVPRIAKEAHCHHNDDHFRWRSFPRLERHSVLQFVVEVELGNQGGVLSRDSTNDEEDTHCGEQQENANNDR